MNALLQINRLNVGFDTDAGYQTALHDISFQVQRGEIVALVGESGSGKSVTSLSVMQLLSTPRARYAGGEIWFSADGERPVNLLGLAAPEMRRIRGKEIAMVFQEPMTSLNPVFRCGEQVSEAIRLHLHLPHAAARQLTLSLFEQVKLPDPAGIYARYPHQLSGGQKQRVMIAIAMSCKPALLIADEPTTALDVTVQRSILQLIRSLQQQHDMGVVFITHDLSLVSMIADRVVVMYRGNIVEQGSAKAILHAPQHPYTKSLLACRPALHSKGERLPVVTDFMTVSDTGDITEILVSDAVRPGPEPTRVVTVPSAEPQKKILINVTDCSVWYTTRKTWLGRPARYVKAVDGVSFQVREGETLGIVGESGCGKTTLGRALLRLVEPTGGSISYNGAGMQTLSQAQLRGMREHMQIIFQDPYSSLNPRMCIGHAIQEPLAVHGRYGSSAGRKEKVMELLEKVQLLPGHYYRYPHEFSGGQRQRIVIARALALQPAFIICDESVSSLDVSVQAQVLNLLNDLKKEFGFTTIFISHDLSVVRYISDRILVMQAGKIVEAGDAQQVFNHPASPYTRELVGLVQEPGMTL